MSSNHHVILRNLRREFQTASEQCGPFFHAILKFPKGQWRGTDEQYREALHALAVGLLTPKTWGAIEAPSQQLLVASAENGESEWAFIACNHSAALTINRLTTRAFYSLPADSTSEEPYHPFARKPYFRAEDFTRWMLFVYRRLVECGRLVISRPATELEFNRSATSFPLEELDPRVIVTYLSVDAALASVYAIEMELNVGNRSPAAPATTEQGLNRTEEVVLSIIKSQPKNHGITGKGILKELRAKGIDLAESSLRKHILPKLAKKHGVVNHRAAGGYLIP